MIILNILINLNKPFSSGDLNLTNLVEWLSGSDGGLLIRTWISANLYFVQG